jgi:hypothetical protein
MHVFQINVENKFSWPKRFETYFICLHRGGDKTSMPLPLKENGGSSSMDDEERSAVGRNLMTNACPPAKSCHQLLYG